MSKKTVAAKSKHSRKNAGIFQQPWTWIIGGILLVAVIAIGAILLGGNQTNDQADGTDVVAEALPLTVSVDEAKRLQDEGAFVLDVREPEEWNDYHAPGSTLIPLAELPARLSEVPADQDIVVVCRSGNRSQSGRDILLDAGFASVTSMAGGLNEWKSSGYPTVTGP